MDQKIAALLATAEEVANAHCLDCDPDLIKNGRTMATALRAILPAVAEWYAALTVDTADLAFDDWQVVMNRRGAAHTALIDAARALEVTP